MREALTAAGWRNYSLFLRPEDGMVVGYFEADDVDAAQDAIARAAISPRWEAAMSEYFAPGGGERLAHLGPDPLVGGDVIGELLGAHVQQEAAALRAAGLAGGEQVLQVMTRHSHLLVEKGGRRGRPGSSSGRSLGRC